MTQGLRGCVFIFCPVVNLLAISLSEILTHVNSLFHVHLTLMSRSSRDLLQYMQGKLVPGPRDVFLSIVISLYFLCIQCIILCLLTPLHNAFLNITFNNLLSAHTKGVFEASTCSLFRFAYACNVNLSGSIRRRVNPYFLLFS